MLARGQLDEFAERGFLVLPQVVPAEMVAPASCAIDQLVERDPPGPQARGPYNYWLQARQAPALAALLVRSPAFGLAEALTGPRTLDAPRQVQLALNIPPFGHRPGMGHIDGFPPEPDGRPGNRHGAVVGELYRLERLVVSNLLVAQHIGVTAAFAGENP